jgi:imidazolonepropionase-like amidohydrolase
LLIEGDTITRVGRDLEAPVPANVIDARNRIVIPGFVDAHRQSTP